MCEQAAAPILTVFFGCVVSMIYKLRAECGVQSGSKLQQCCDVLVPAQRVPR